MQKASHLLDGRCDHKVFLPVGTMCLSVPGNRSFERVNSRSNSAIASLEHGPGYAA